MHLVLAHVTEFPMWQQVDVKNCHSSNDNAARRPSLDRLCFGKTDCWASELRNCVLGCQLATEVNMVSLADSQETSLHVWVRDSGVVPILKILRKSRPLGNRARFAEEAQRTEPI